MHEVLRNATCHMLRHYGKTNTLSSFGSPRAPRLRRRPRARWHAPSRVELCVWPASRSQPRTYRCRGGEGESEQGLGRDSGHSEALSSDRCDVPVAGGTGGTGVRGAECRGDALPNSIARPLRSLSLWCYGALGGSGMDRRGMRHERAGMFEAWMPCASSHWSLHTKAELHAGRRPPRAEEEGPVTLSTHARKLVRGVLIALNSPQSRRLPHIQRPVAGHVRWSARIRRTRGSCDWLPGLALPRPLQPKVSCSHLCCVAASHALDSLAAVALPASGNIAWPS